MIEMLKMDQTYVRTYLAVQYSMSQGFSSEVALPLKDWMTMFPSLKTQNVPRNSMKMKEVWKKYEKRGDRRGLRWKKNDRKKAENIRIGDWRRELGEDNIE